MQRLGGVKLLEAITGLSVVPCVRWSEEPVFHNVTSAFSAEHTCP